MGVGLQHQCSQFDSDTRLYLNLTEFEMLLGFFYTLGQNKKDMKTLITFFTLLIFCISFSQGRKECESSERKQYQENQRKKWENNQFVVISKEDALKPIYNYVETRYVQNPAEKKDIQDSIKLRTKQILQTKKDIDTTDFETEFKIYDSLRILEAKKMIGNISKPLVIKSERKGKNWAILYYDFKYDEMLAFGAGYWISLSKDAGITWKKYYTGITENKNYNFKSNSKESLWYDEDHLQIEADIVRMTSPRIHPMPPEYETIKDNALVIIDLREIKKDSDGDGLTDIEEYNLFLNPFSKDTDGDGIIDSEDMNPRFASITNDFVKFYEGIMFGENTIRKGNHPNEDFFISFSTIPKTKDKREFYEDFGVLNTTKLLVTDDPNLQRISPKDSKIIILTTKEYEEFKKKPHSGLEQLYYSPLFKCNREENTYLLDTNASYSGESYKVRRTKTGWKVIVYSSWIS